MYKKYTKIIIPLYIFFFAEHLSAENFLPREGELKLIKFYSSNPYSKILLSPEKKILKESDKNTCDGLIESQFGFRTDKKIVFSPTKVAADGVDALFANNIFRADECLKTLRNGSFLRGDSIFFPFNFDFVPYMPYNLRAPWVSAISQGISLGLASYLYYFTKEEEYKKLSDKVFNSYKIDIKNGGFTRYYEDSVLFEEYPADEEIAVFNGAAVAALALWDYYVITQNKEALELFNKYIKWLEKNIQRYETTDPEYGVILTYYSLANKRPDLLLRFYGDGIYLIKKIELFKNKDLVDTLTVGTPNDDLPAKNIYLMADSHYTNWSKRSKKGRVINQNRGEYNHSPFFIYIPDTEDISIRITYTKLDKEDKKVFVQGYDGGEYHNFGELNGERGIEKISTYEIPSRFIKIWKSHANLYGPQVEPKYLDDNYLLLKLLVEASNSQVLSSYLRRWEDSVYFTPGEWYNHYPKRLLHNNTKILSNPGICKNGIANPALIKTGDIYYLFYDCIIDKQNIRTSLATGKDIDSLKDNGWILNNNIVDSKNLYLAENPYIIMGESNNYNLFLFGRDQKTLFKFFSSTLWNWELSSDPSISLKDSTISDYFIINDKTEHHLYYIDTQSPNIINELNIDKNDRRSVLNGKKFMRFNSIAGDKIDGAQFFLIRTKLPARTDTLLAVRCKEDESMILYSEPLMIENINQDSGNPVKNDYFIFKDNNSHYLLYTSPDNQSTSIFISKIDMKEIQTKIQEICK
jgi:hypothetical protein